MPDDAVNRVLYVGADGEYFMDLSLALERANPSFAVTLVADGGEADEFVGRESVHCVVVEPTVEPGWRSIVDDLRARTPDLPVLLADDGDLDGADAAMAAGVDDVLDRNEAPSERLAVRLTALVGRFRTLIDERTDLDWYEALLHGVGDFVVVFGADSAVRYVSPSIEHVTGYTPADVEAMGPFGYVHHDDQPDVIDAFYEMMLEPAGTTTKVETRARHADGTWRIHEGVGVNLLGVDPIDGIVVTVRDITDPARPKALLDEHLDRETDAFFALDTDLRFTYVNERAEALLGEDSATLEGAPLEAAFDGSTVVDGFRANFAEALSSGRTATFETAYPPTDSWMEVRAYASDSGLSVYLRDVTERKERERELERYEAMVEAVTDGVFTADTDGYFTFVNEAFVELTGYDRDELVGGHISLIADEDAIERGGQLDERLTAGEVTEGVIEAELVRADGERVPSEARFGLLLHDGETGERVGVVRDVSERRRREEHLEALNRLNGVIRDINHMLVRTGTRERLERLVCERLTESGPYALAWIGDVDQGTGTVSPRASSRRDGSSEELVRRLADLDGEGEASGPVTEAAASGVERVVSDLGAVDAPWGPPAASRGYRSMLAIPLSYNGVRYGVLTVYSTRADAFDEEHREVLAQLGEVVGHAINAIDRQAALLSDRVVECKLRSRDAAAPFADLADAPLSVSIESVVPVDEGADLLYLSVSGGERAEVESILADAPSIREYRAVRSRGDETTYEVRVVGLTLLPDLASYGAYVRSATLADGALTVVVELSPTQDVRAVYEAIRADYPDLELISRQDTDHVGRAGAGLEELIQERLTPQQARALETAYYAGFFEWPRDSTGEEVAASLGIAPSTFHKHLRLGEHKVMGALFDA